MQTVTCPSENCNLPAPRNFESDEAGLEEVVLCSGAGEILFTWQCKSLERRLRLMEQIGQQAEQLRDCVRGGRFDRLEIHSRQSRIICQVLPDRRLFVRSVEGAP